VQLRRMGEIYKGAEVVVWLGEEEEEEGKIGEDVQRFEEVVAGGGEFSRCGGECVLGGSCCRGIATRTRAGMSATGCMPWLASASLRGWRTGIMVVLSRSCTCGSGPKFSTGRRMSIG